MARLLYYGSRQQRSLCKFQILLRQFQWLSSSWFLVESTTTWWFAKWKIPVKLEEFLPIVPGENKNLWNYKIDRCCGKKQSPMDVWWFSVGFLPLRWICVQFIFDIQNSSPTVHSKVGFGRADMVNVDFFNDMLYKNFNPPRCPAVRGPRNDAIFTIKRTNEVRNLKQKSSRQNVGVSINQGELFNVVSLSNAQNTKLSSYE